MSAAVRVASSAWRPASVVFPGLENGDRMDAAEFERRYAACPEIKKAELIEGVVHVASPVREWHSVPHGLIVNWLVSYWTATPGVIGGPDGTLRLDDQNQPQPDGYLRILESHGGQSRRDADGYVSGSPELAAEVGLSTASIDMNAKFRLYLGRGVLEYLV